MQIFEEENLEEVYKRFLQNRKDKEQWMIKEAAESERKPFSPWTMVFLIHPRVCPWDYLIVLCFSALVLSVYWLLSLHWPPHERLASDCSMGFRDYQGIKTVLTFCLYSLDLGSWLVTFTISIDQNISETALFSISVISHKYLTIHLKHNQDPGHMPGPGC